MIKIIIGIFTLLFFVVAANAQNNERVEFPQDSIEIMSKMESFVSPPKLQFALKTNLLYDAATVLNIEVEIPVNRRWSLSGEWIFPWWTSCKDNTVANNRRNTLQLLQGNVEGRYWLGDRLNQAMMTGWFGGVYGGVGVYDLERNAEGCQGEFYIVGLSGGYAHTINKGGDLRMEYSLGIGYMQSDYQSYREHFGIDNKWHAIRQRSGQYGWFGPTKAKVSLVWMLNKQRK